MTALATTGRADIARREEMDVAAIVERKRKIVEVMQAVMTDGEHYGTIPGCGDKPALFKSGAEVLATTFGLAPEFTIIERDHGNGHREYRVTCTYVRIGTDIVVGSGVGCCSTLESKYRWRKGERQCPSCGRSTIIKGQEQYGGGWLCWGKRGGCGAKWKDGAKEIESQSVERVENPDIADQYNTVLKMAKKRAQVDATLTAVAASDLLTQDLEDLQPVPPTREPVVGTADPATSPSSRAELIGALQKELSKRPGLKSAEPTVLDRIFKARTLEELRSDVMPRFSALKRGTPEREEAVRAYKAAEIALQLAEQRDRQPPPPDIDDGGVPF